MALERQRRVRLLEGELLLGAHDGLLRVEEAALLLRASRSAVYRLMKAGELRRVRVRYVGTRVLMSEVRALWAERRG